MLSVRLRVSVQSVRLRVRAKLMYSTFSEASIREC